MPAIAQSRIQTWRGTRDMPGYMRQIGWEDSMRYSWLFPIAVIWRHFSNEEFWTALQQQKAVLQNLDLLRDLEPCTFPSAAYVHWPFRQDPCNHRGGTT